MAKVITTELQHSGASAANITLDSSKNVTCENNLQVDGNVTVTGTLPADKLTGALPAISGASLTGITTRTQPFRNLVVNGACKVAQRGTTKATHTGHGYFTVDRFYTSIGGENEGREEAQIALTSSDTGPWAKGFRHALQITNGNQTSTDTADYLWALTYFIEAQDVANSNWDYTDPNSKLTISFWVKSSVAQNFYGYFRCSDGTNKHYPFETGSLTANTWTKITKTVPGHADISMDNNNGIGFSVYLPGFLGTYYTDNASSLNTWHTWANDTKSTPDWSASMDDWWRTNNATLAFTGLQVEAGDTATEFEHRSFGDELTRCQRYYYMQEGDTDDWMCTSMAKNGAAIYFFFNFPVPMRTKPSYTAADKNLRHFAASSSDQFGAHGLVLSHQNTTWYYGNGQTTTVLYKESANASGGQAGMMECMADGVKLQFSAEL